MLNKTDKMLIRLHITNAAAMVMNTRRARGNSYKTISAIWARANDKFIAAFKEYYKK